MAKRKSNPEVYTLVVDVGRKTDDGLPVGATGAGLMCFASGHSEEEAVHETVAVLKQAGLAPLEVTAYGTITERQELGHEIGPEEHRLIAQALSDNAVIVAELTPFFGRTKDS